MGKLSGKPVTSLYLKNFIDADWAGASWRMQKCLALKFSRYLQAQTFGDFLSYSTI